MELVEQEVSDGIAVLALNRPDRRNALSGALVEALIDALRVRGADPAVRVVILTGRGPAFCAGGDLADGMAGDGFIHGVIKDFDNQMLQGTVVGSPDIHAGTAADRFQAFQNLDIGGGVGIMFRHRAFFGREQIRHAADYATLPLANKRARRQSIRYVE